MARSGLPVLQIAAALLIGMSFLKAWDSRQDGLSSPSSYAAGSGAQTDYSALTRAEIMLSEAGGFLN